MAGETVGNGDFIRISNREIYDAVRRLEDKVADLLAQDTTVGDHEQRLRKLENRFTGVMVSGVAVALGAAAAIIWRLVIK